MALKLTAAQLEQIRRHGEATYPHECCGVLTGEMLADGSKQVRAVVQCGNAHNDPVAKLVSDRSAGAGAHSARGLRARRRRHRLLPFASRRCRELVGQRSGRSSLDGLLLLITSVEQGKAVQTNSFELAGDEASKRFEDEEIVVE